MLVALVRVDVEQVGGLCGLDLRGHAVHVDPEGRKWWDGDAKSPVVVSACGHCDGEDRGEAAFWALDL